MIGPDHSGYAGGVFDPNRVRRTIEKARRTAGGRDWPVDFSDRLTTPRPTMRDVFRVVREGGLRPPGLAEAVVPVHAAAGLPRAAAGQTAVSWVGHASYVLQIGGLTVLTDPVWSRRIPGVRPRLTPPGIAWEVLPRVDAVLISHNHYDHLDAPTIRRLPRDTPVLVPANLAWWFRRRGFRDITELDWYESRRIGAVEFDFVPAHHWSRRTMFDACQSLWGGWMLTTDGGNRVYFAGDSGYGHFFGQIGARYPGIDLAMLPIGAYRPQWFMQPVHLDPDEAVRACLDVRAARMATMHWGTFVLSAEPSLEPPERARRAWAAVGRPRSDLWDLAVGETRML
jgi:L-ascorbate metabolism protein UlaG (beta-lactamase superfamily)